MTLMDGQIDFFNGVLDFAHTCTHTHVLTHTHTHIHTHQTNKQ